MSAPLAPSRLQRAEHYFAFYAAAVPAELRLDDALKPSFWAHLGDRLRQHDTIRLIPDDGAYFAELLVLSAGRGFANVKLLRHIPLNEDELSEMVVPDELEVKYRGPHCRWSVIRKSDGHVLKEQLQEKGDAIREAAGYKLAA